MKKTLVSIAAASLIVTSAMAADKGIDIVTTGQAVVYYQTAADNGDTDSSLFDKDSASANVGVQLNLDADLKNGFTLGSQLTYLGTAGLEGNLVSGTMQNVGGAVTNDDITDEIAITKFYVAKKIANTTVKIGRQELPKSLSPLAFSEGWNVYKNTFEAILAVNTDIPDTTLVGAYVTGGNTNTDLGDFSNIGTTDDTTTNGGVYMLTAQNKSIPMTTLTASYYDAAKIITNDGVNVVWIDAKIADKSLPMGLNFGIQAGSIMTETSTYADTTAFGAKVAMKPIDALSLTLAYTSVDGDDDKTNVAVQNLATSTKTPLYTQMVANQTAISLDADTIMLQAAYNTGGYGKVIAQGSMTSAGQSNQSNTGRDTDGTDYTELELIYKIKAADITYLAAIINQSWSKENADNMDNNNIVRLWARYNF